MNFQSEYQKLNKSQKEAVDNIEGPLMVIAGPGTGKTQVLSLRIANILQKTQANPGNILALTFTESGAIAMKKRLAKIIGNTAYFVPIYTFHSFCNQIIKDYPDKFIELRHSGSDENGQWNFSEMQALSDIEKLSIFESLINSCELKILRPIKDPYFYLSSIAKSIQSLKREGIVPKDFENILSIEHQKLEAMPKINEKTGKELLKYKEQLQKYEKNIELLEIYKGYLKELGKRNRYDFEDMVLFVIQKLQDDKDLLAFLQERFQYVLIDEYQDTNNAQNKLIEIIMSYFDNPNIFVVGDDDQSIYKFQGANLDNFLYLNKLYPDLKYIVLNENYRSSNLILDGAKHLIKNNQKRVSNVISKIDKNINACGVFKNEQEKIKIVEALNDVSERFFIVNEIQKLKNQNTNLSEIAILCRRNSDLAEIEEFLEKSEIPYQLEGGIDILKDIEIQKLLKLLKLINNPQENNFLYFEVMQFDFLDLPINEVFEAVTNDLTETKNLLKIIKEEAKIEPPTLFENSEFRPIEKNNKMPNIKVFLKKILQWKKLACNITLSEFFEILIKESNFLNFILNQKNHVELLIRLNSLFEFVKETNREKIDINIKEFLEKLEIMQNYNLTLQEKTFYHKKEAVRLMTAHRAKGLEFEHVFIYKCIDKVWGNNQSREFIKLPSLSELKNEDDNTDSLEDERRLFFTAMTRAKKSLYLLYSQKYQINGSEREFVASIFVNELENICEKLDISEMENMVVDRLTLNLRSKRDFIIASFIEDYAKEKLDKFTLSVTALNNYLNCPRKFFYNNILKLPRAKPSYMAFGTAVHKALEIFFKEFQEKNEIPSVEFLICEFNKAIEKEIVIAEEKERWKSKGSEVLKGYFENYKYSFTKPIFLEKFLKTYLDDIAISGKIDKIEYIDSNKKTIKVVDYKTGNPKTRNEIEGSTKNSDGDLKRQILFYKLLTDLSPGFIFETVESEFDFIEPKDNKYRKESFCIEKNEIEDLKKLIKDSMTKIRALEFEKTNDISKCQRCDFREICGR